MRLACGDSGFSDFEPSGQFPDLSISFKKAHSKPWMLCQSLAQCADEYAYNSLPNSSSPRNGH